MTPCLLTCELTDESACGDEDPPGDVLGQVTGEVGVDRCRVLGRGRVECGLCTYLVQQAPAIQPDDVGLVLRPGRQPGLCAGADHIRPHSVFLELAGDGQGQPVDPALARRIARPAVVSAERERAGVDDRTAALGHHLRRRGPAGLERRDEMAVEQVVELCAGDAEDRLAGEPRGARAIHQDVDAAEFAYAPVDQRLGGSRSTYTTDDIRRLHRKTAETVALRNPLPRAQPKGAERPRLAPPVPLVHGLDRLRDTAVGMGLTLMPWQESAAKYITAKVPTASTCTTRCASWSPARTARPR